jgi:hypothetical protein
LPRPDLVKLLEVEEVVEEVCWLYLFPNVFVSGL